nr:peptidase T [Candidatus Sigynarchaeota archaeon]
MERDKFSVLTRFLRYVKIYTTSEEEKEEIPSTPRQFDLARVLVQELKEMGVSDVNMDEHCIVVATIPATVDPNRAPSIPTICFIAHIDTSPEEPGENVQPRIIIYLGGSITFPGNPELVITPAEIQEIPVDMVGEELVTSDGTTLLGADDKAGIAEIMAAAAFLMDHPDYPHGIIKLVFTPDEEVGHSVDKVDVSNLSAAFGYTLDGDMLGVIEAECFNAASGVITIQGFNIHPGYAYGKMVNAIRILRDVISVFPDDIAPETMKDHDGYLHPAHIKGAVNEARLDFILRDFDHDKLQAKITTIKDGIAAVQQRWPRAKITVEFKDGYRNMKEIMDQNLRVIEIAEEAIKMAGVLPRHKAIRGGTDGARLCFMGLPCPNLFAGGMNFHSKKEFVPVSWMEKAVLMILNIIEIVAR